FRNSRVADERTFYFRRAKSVASDVQNVVDPANDPEIAVFIPACAVASQIITFELTPVLLSIARLVPVDRAQHRRPRPANDEFPAHIRSDLAPALVHNGRIDAKERECPAARLCGSSARERRNHDRSCFRLPPRIDDRTHSATD